MSVDEKEIINEENKNEENLEAEKTIEESVVNENKANDELKDMKDKLQRLAAEFDNYKKRTGKEKEKIYSNALVDVVSNFLPVIDNMERALKAAEESNDQCLLDGIQMVSRQMTDALTSLKVKPVKALGESFNPEFHNAVMHVEDENFGVNEVIEEFQKGYIFDDEIVIRHSMVKVAN